MTAVRARPSKTPRIAEMPAVGWPVREQADARAVADALAELVGAIGRPAFASRFLDAMRALAGVELCSVFAHEPGDTVRLLFAEGDPPHMPDFPVRASLDYAGNYWRSDHQITRLSRGACKGPVVVRKRAAEIADPAYRMACYDRADVRERLSIVWPGTPTLVAHGYRTSRTGLFLAADIDRLECNSGVLMAAVERHQSIAEAKGPIYGESGVVQSLLALRRGLSAREAEIAAAMILGETQSEIASRKQLSLSSVITYRRRAYGKLGVADRRDLVRLHRSLVAGEVPASGGFVDTPRGAI